MPVAVIIAFWVLAVVTLVAWILMGWIPRRRLRQNETAGKFFGDDQNSRWRSTAMEDWSEEERDTALRYYNTAGRQVRIGGIRVDSIPEHHRRSIMQLATMIGDDAAHNERWSDLMWLGNRLGKRDDADPHMDGLAAPPTESNGEQEPQSDSDHRVNDLASALGLSESRLDTDSGHLPNVPAWILEAKEALKTPSPSNSSVENLKKAKPSLSGSEFPWPEPPKPEAPGEVPESSELLSEDDPADSTAGEPVATATLDAVTANNGQDEIERLRRKADKARRRADEARDLTVQFAREGRRKKARAAAKIVYEQSDLAKRLKKRARKLANKTS